VRTGIHEMLIGAAYVLGPFLGGVATEVQSLWFPLTTALRAPFQLCAVVTIGGMAVEYFLWRRMVRGTNEAAV
jgi:hypothetical protein